MYHDQPSEVYGPALHDRVAVNRLGTRRTHRSSARYTRASGRRVPNEEGVSLIEGAEGRYLVALAETQSAQTTPPPAPATGTTPASGAPPAPGTALPSDRLTIAGPQLYVEVVAAIKIVEQLLVAQLPTVEDINLAQGRVARLGDLQVQPTEVTLTAVDQTADILVLGAIVTRATSNAPGIVAIDNLADVQKGTRLLRIKCRASGSDPVTVTVATEGGRTANITVTVPRP